MIRSLQTCLPLHPASEPTNNRAKTRRVIFIRPPWSFFNTTDAFPRIKIFRLSDYSFKFFPSQSFSILKIEFHFLNIENLQFAPLCCLKSDWFNNQSQRNSKYNFVQTWNEQRLHNLSSEDLEPEPIDQWNSPSSNWSETWVKKNFIAVAAAVVLCVTRLTATLYA